jgi:uncharacterized protein (UPF0371 family)
MGVNRAGFAITNDAVVCEAAKQELIRRYFRYSCEYAMGFAERETVQRSEMLMEEMDVSPELRRVVGPARQAAVEARETGKGNDGVYAGAAIELKDGSLLTGKNTYLMHATSSLILNAIKRVAEIPDRIHLLAPNVIESVGHLKKGILRAKNVSLDLEEALIALSISAATNPTAQLAMERLPDLGGCEVHLTHIPTPGDEAGLRRLGVNLTSDPQFPGRQLFNAG